MNHSRQNLPRIALACAGETQRHTLGRANTILPRLVDVSKVEMLTTVVLLL